MTVFSPRDPLISTGTMKKEKEVYDKSIKDYIDKITTPIFEKVPQEDISNSMTTPTPYKSNGFRYLVRFNNYRRQIQVKEKTNSTSIRIKGAISKLPMELNINPRTKIISIKNYNKGITIQYGKNILTAIYACPLIHGHKQTRLIERPTIDGINTRMDEIKDNIKERLDNALNEFSRKFTLSLPFKKVIWVRHENWIKGDEFIDNIPRETIIHDTIGKKVYAEGWEFIGGKDKEPTATIKNYIKTRAIEDIAPEIANSINDLGNHLIPTIRNLDNSIQMEIHNKKIHLGVLNSMDKTLKDIRESLPKRGLLKWL